MLQKHPSLLLSLTLPLLQTACTDPGPQLSALQICESTAGYTGEGERFKYIGHVRDTLKDDEDGDVIPDHANIVACEKAVEENPNNLHAKALLVRVYQAADKPHGVDQVLSTMPETEPTGEVDYVRGVSFLLGDDDDKDERHEALLLEAHAKGFAPASYELAQIWDDKDFANDIRYSKSFEYYNAAAEAGMAVAFAQVGYSYEGGFGVEANAELANEWYEKGVERGSRYAMRMLGDNLEFGYGIEQDLERARLLFEQSADLGNYAAKCELGEIYANGKGVETNYKLALDLFTEAAEQGSGQCMTNLAWAYRYGNGVSQDFAMTRHWAKKGVEKNNSDAYFYMGELYRYGLGVEQDYELAHTYFVSASELGEDVAPAELGEIYEQGLSVEVDTEKAIEYYTLAAERGNGWSMNKLGEIYRDGELHEQNLNKALEYFFAAADDDNSTAVENLTAFKDEYGDNPSLDPELAERLNSPKPDWVR